MSDLDTDLELGQCNRCQGYVLKAFCGGQLAVVDPSPLTLDGYRQALVSGRRTFRLALTASGRPHRLQDDTPSWATDRQRLAAHPCPQGAVRPLPVVVQDPPRAPVTHGSGQAGRLRPDAFAGATIKSSDATIAIRPRSDGVATRRKWPYLARRCWKCETIIGTDQRVGVSRGDYWIWVIHERCAP